MARTPNLYYSLLITDSTDLDNNQVLIEILNGLGSLQITSTSVNISFQEKNYDLIIVDAVSVIDPIKIVSRLRVLDSKAKIVVLSTSMHWVIAKAIIQAGATDYLPKSLTKEEMLANLQAILKQV